MTYDDIYKKACDVIGAENISMYRPAVFSTEPDTFLHGVEAFIPNTIMIWLKNDDLIWYRAREGEQE